MSGFYYSTIFFDIDGTITDSTSVILRSLQQMLMEETEMHYELSALEFALSLPNTELGAYLHLPNWDELLKKGQKYYKQNASSITLFSGMEDTIRLLSQKGIRLGIITSKTNAQYASGFANLRVAGYFECIICADETDRFKPNPTPLLEGMRRMNVLSANTLYVGDTKEDMMCAASAGVNSALALWGCRNREGIKATHYLGLPEDLLSLT